MKLLVSTDNLDTVRKVLEQAISELRAYKDLNIDYRTLGLTKWLNIVKGNIYINPTPRVVKHLSQNLVDTYKSVLDIIKEIDNMKYKASHYLIDLSSRVKRIIIIP